MQATQDRLGNDTVILGNSIPRGSLLWQIQGSIRDPRPQARVRTAPIVMLYPMFESSPQVLLIQRNQKVKALAADGAHQPFGKRIGLSPQLHRMETMKHDVSE